METEDAQKGLPGRYSPYWSTDYYIYRYRHLL